MLGASQTKFYKSAARRLNYHTQGMRATKLIPVFEKRIEVNETKIKAFGRHRLLKDHKTIEQMFLDVNKTFLIICKSISKTYLS